jgi:hypothetical protein
MVAHTNTHQKAVSLILPCDDPRWPTSSLTLD